MGGVSEAAWYVLGTFILLEGVACFDLNGLVGVRRIYWGALIVFWAVVLDLSAPGSAARWLIVPASAPLGVFLYLDVKPRIEGLARAECSRVTEAPILDPSEI